MQERKPRKMGRDDLAIIHAKEAAREATMRNLREILPLDPKAAKIVANECVEPLVARHHSRVPKLFQGAYLFSHKGGFSHIQATGVHFNV